MIKRILVALSGSPFTRSAVRHAVDLGCAHDAEVTGVTDMDLAQLANVGPIPLGAGAAAHDLFEHRLKLAETHIDEAIALFESACKDGGRTGCVHRETGDPFERLTQLWRYHDFTVLGLRGLFEYGVVHNPDDLVVRLIAKGVRPILAVAREYRPIQRVLIAYNGSMESAKAMKQFVQMRLWSDPAVKIVTFADGKDRQALPQDAAHYCHAHGLTPETELVDGGPQKGLLDHATEWEADLIVMGSTSRARIFKHLLGDTALHAIRHAEVPLFLAQ